MEEILDILAKKKENFEKKLYLYFLILLTYQFSDVWNTIKKNTVEVMFTTQKL